MISSLKCRKIRKSYIMMYKGVPLLNQTRLQLSRTLSINQLLLYLCNASTSNLWLKRFASRMIIFHWSTSPMYLLRQMTLVLVLFVKSDRISLAWKLACFSEHLLIVPACLRDEIKVHFSFVVSYEVNMCDNFCYCLAVWWKVPVLINTISRFVILSPIL